MTAVAGPARLRVLLVDDEESVRLTLAAVLERDGYEVVSATSATDARRLVAAERFDILLADLQLGDGESGVEVATAALRHDPDLVTIILTGYVTTEAAVEALRGGVGNFLAKPCNLDELRLALARGLEKRRLLADLRDARREAAGKAQAEQARAAAERHARRLADLQDGTAALAGAVSQREVARVILKTALQVLGASGGVVAMLTADGVRLRVLEALDLDIEDRWLEFPIDAEAPITEAVRGREPVLLESPAARAERFPALAAALPRREAAWAAMPLLAGDRCLGALGLVFAQEHAFDEPDRHFIGLLSAQCAQALDRARLYDEERRARAEFAALVEASPDVISRFDRELRHLFTNSAGKTNHQVDMPDDVADMWRGQLRLVFQDGQPRDFEYASPLPAGLRDLQARVIPLPAPDGSVAEVMTVTSDITDRKRLEAALQASNQLLRDLFRQAPAMICLLAGADHVFEMANAEWCRVVGRTPEQVLGKTLREVFPEMEPAVFELFDQVYATGQPYVDREARRRLDRGAGGVEEAYFESVYQPITSGGEVMAILVHATEVTDRVRGRREAERSAEQLRLAMDAGQVGAWEWDFATDRIDWSPRMCELVGIRPEDFDGERETFMARVHPDDRAVLDQAIRSGIESGQGWNGDYRVVWPDGTVHWLTGAGRVISAEGKPQRMLGVVTDTTERRTAQAWDQFLAAAGAELSASLEAEQTLNRLAQLAVPILADWCAVEVPVEVGASRTVALAHVNPDKVQWAWDLQRRYPSDPNAPTGVPQVLRSGKSELYSDIPMELLEQGAQDEEHLRIIRELAMQSVMVVPLAVPGRVLGAITFISAESGRRYDQADLARAEQLAARAALAIENAALYGELRAERNRLQQVLDSLPQGLSVVDAAGKVVMSNAAGLAIAGRPLNRGLDGYAEHGIWHINGEPMRAEDTPLARALRDRQVLNAEQMLVRQSETGERIPILVSAAPLLDDDGGLLGAVSVFEDISRIKDLERQKDEFLSAAAHDLRTPVTGIRGVLQLLQRRARRAGSLPADQVLDGLADVERSTRRMSSLIDQLLDLSRLDSGHTLELQRDRVDLPALVRDVADECRRISPDHTIHVEVADADLAGQWDGARLERALSNLTGNAIKYSPNGGEVLLTVRREGDWAVVSVRDQGIGIPPDEIDRVFERFQRASNVPRQTSGTGVGLAYVRQVAIQHGGRVSAESTVGQGSTITLWLPIDGGE